MVTTPVQHRTFTPMRVAREGAGGVMAEIPLKQGIASLSQLNAAEKIRQTNRARRIHSQGAWTLPGWWDRSFPPHEYLVSDTLG